MQCSGCGADIPLAGNVCPFCGCDKADDKRYEWTKFMGGIFGLLVGFSYFDSFLYSISCIIPGYIAGAIFGFFMPKRKPTAKPEITPSPPQFKPTDTIEAKLIQLQKMHQQGLLTKEEYNSKRAEYLAKL